MRFNSLALHALAVLAFSHAPLPSFQAKCKHSSGTRTNISDHGWIVRLAETTRDYAWSEGQRASVPLENMTD